MAIKGIKITRKLILIIGSLVVLGFALNWFVTYKLQKTLNEKLAEEVLKATDGFYRCSFDDLSVGLFTGELSLKGVELIPDSLALLRWQEGDSLPPVYYNIHIDEVHLRGVNLTWLRSYANLHFSLFELKSPDIKAFQPAFTTDTVKKEEKIQKTLYDMISPYINELSVTRIRLNDAAFSYIIEDSISPVTYSLKDINFRAYNFRLDKDSYSSGNLLYCEHFEFEADKPQDLLYSNDIVLKTDNIKLSTIESVIKIEGVHIAPKDTVWANRTTVAGGYLKAEVKSVGVGGVHFERKNALNYLHAASFDISTTDIQYYTVAEDVTTKKKNNDDEIVLKTSSWSLYEILSPLLQSISIDKIGIDKTKFNYTVTQKGFTDIYTLNRFDFHANKFLVDPDSEKYKKFWYVDDFMIKGDDIEGEVNSNNSKISIDKLILNSSDKFFELADIRIEPLYLDNKKDYVSGGIKFINIKGLDYDTGISAEEFKMDSFNIQYYRIAPRKVDNKALRNDDSSVNDILSFFSPYANYLSVKNIDLSDINVAIHDKAEGGIYRLQHLNFYATEFLVNDSTRANSQYLFTFEDIGLKFRDFNNMLPGGDYRLKIKNADISTLTGHMKLEGVNLIPQLDKKDIEAGTYLGLNTPLIEIRGFSNDAYLSEKAVKLNSLAIKSPDIKLYNTGVSDKGKSRVNTSGQFSVIAALYIDSLDIDNTDFHFFDKVAKDSLSAVIPDLRLRGAKWDLKKRFEIQELILRRPLWDYVSYKDEVVSISDNRAKAANKLPAIFGDNIHIGKFEVSSPEVNITEPRKKTYFKTDLLALNELKMSGRKDNGSFSLASIEVSNPYFSYYVEKDSIKAIDTTRIQSPREQDFYEMLRSYTNKGYIGNITIENANIKGEYAVNRKVSKTQLINSVNLNVKGLDVDAEQRQFDMADLKFSTEDLEFPIIDGFYTVSLGAINLDKAEGLASLSDIKMIAAYPKMDFAYRHPTHMDWFDVRVGEVSFKGLDYTALFKKNMLKASELDVKDVALLNLKNKQIYTPPKKQPMLYTKLQDLPIGVDIDTANVYNFTVLYEELPKRGFELGKIFFEGMNGRFSRLSNIPNYPQEYMRLYVDGSFMGKGPFSAIWDMPVSKDYDCFVLQAHLDNYDLKSLNPIFEPLAKAEVTDGRINMFDFRTEATSYNANADMLLLYNDLSVSVLKSAETEEENKFLTKLANMIVRNNNPNNAHSKPREANIYIDRDPYHSSFNYFWQILQPAMVESVGVSQEQQNFVKKAAGFFTKVKNFFTGKKTLEEPEKDKGRVELPK